MLWMNYRLNPDIFLISQAYKLFGIRTVFWLNTCLVIRYVRIIARNFWTLLLHLNNFILIFFSCCGVTCDIMWNLCDKCRMRVVFLTSHFICLADFVISYKGNFTKDTARLRLLPSLVSLCSPYVFCLLLP